MVVTEKEEWRRLQSQLTKQQRQWNRRRVVSNKGIMIGGSIIAIFVIAAIFGPYLLPFDPFAMKVAERLQAPSTGHLLGTDEFGRDLLTRLIYGARQSLVVGFGVAIISSFLGLIIGIYASYYKTLDHVLMRICDGLIAIPGILLAIALMAALGASITNVVIALTIVFTPGIARVVRANALVVKEQTYIEAIRSQGASDFRIIWSHIVPNTLSPLLVQTTFVFAEAIISEAALSFLGAGIPAPEPSWGNMLQASKLVIYKAWWMVVFPGITIVLAVLSLNIVGDGLRDLLDPKVTVRSKKWYLVRRKDGRQR